MPFSYYGTKDKNKIKHYPAPKNDIIIEPFAGAAKYSLEYWETPKIILIEADKKIYGVLKYLQSASKKDIMSLPDIKYGDNLKKHTYLSIGEINLIGLQLNRGSARKVNKRGNRSSWDEKDKIRIANDLEKMRHWDIRFGDALEIMPIDNNATYFIDPPYMVQSHKYSKWRINYIKLKNIIDNLNTQVIVCGNEGCTWIDFQHSYKASGTCKNHTERIFLKDRI